MLRVPLALGVLAAVGCRQPVPPPPVVDRPVAAAAVRVVVFQTNSPASGDWERSGRVRGRPLTWCAEPRTPDPLLLDALELGTIDEYDGSALDDLRIMHRIPLMPADQIAVVTDEDSCETAARAYDAATSIYRTISRAQSFQPVHVVSLGSLYLVESAGDRSQGYEVKFFSRSWKHLRGGFGVEF